MFSLNELKRLILFSLLLIFSTCFIRRTVNVDGHFTSLLGWYGRKYCDVLLPHNITKTLTYKSDCITYRSRLVLIISLIELKFAFVKDTIVTFWDEYVSCLLDARLFGYLYFLGQINQENLLKLTY